MEFKVLTTIEQLKEIDELSNSKTQVLFKHSTRCSVSHMAKKILDRELSNALENNIDIYYLDLLNHRDISNHIATRYDIIHESPQLLLIKNGKCIYVAAHSDVSLNDAMIKGGV